MTVHKIYSPGVTDTVAMTIPKKLAKELGIKAGDSVIITRKGDTLVVKKLELEENEED